MKKFTIKSILDLNPNTINNMSTADKRELAKAGAKFARDRVRRAKEYYASHENEPRPMAYRIRHEASDKKVKMHDVVWNEYDFMINDSMDDNDLRSKISDIRRFLRTTTSTVTGWKEELTKFRKRVKELNAYITQESYDDIWKWYAEIEEDIGGFQSLKGGSNDVQEYLRDIQVEGSIGTLDEDTRRVIMTNDHQGSVEMGMTLTEYHRWLLTEYDEYSREHPDENLTFAEWRFNAYYDTYNSHKWTNPVEFYSAKDENI